MCPALVDELELNKGLLIALEPKLGEHIRAVLMVLNKKTATHVELCEVLQAFLDEVLATKKHIPSSIHGNGNRCELSRCLSGNQCPTTSGIKDTSLAVRKASASCTYSDVHELMGSIRDKKPINIKAVLKKIEANRANNGPAECTLALYKLISSLPSFSFNVDDTN